MVFYVEGGVAVFLVILQLPDGKGKGARMLLWNHPGHDITGMVVRCKKVVDICEEVRADFIVDKLLKFVTKINNSHPRPSLGQKSKSAEHLVIII